MGNDFVHNPHTGGLNGSVGEFVTLKQPRQLGHPVRDPEAAPVVATPPVVLPESDGDRKVHPTIKLPTFDGKLSLKSFWESCIIVQITITGQIARESAI